MECFIENLACPGNGYLLFLIPFLVVWLFFAGTPRFWWLSPTGSSSKADKRLGLPDTCYNTLVMLQAVGKPWWWILLLLSLVNIVFTI